MVAIEEEFDVKISDEELGALATVGDAVEFLEDRLA
jgi:acyl carrier protein